MVGRVYFPVFPAADVANRFFCAGSFAARTIRFVKVGVAAIYALVIMLSVFLRPFAYRFVIISVIVSVLASAELTDCKLRAGGRAAGMAAW